MGDCAIWTSCVSRNDQKSVISPNSLLPYTDSIANIRRRAETLERSVYDPRKVDAVRRLNRYEDVVILSHESFA